MSQLSGVADSVSVLFLGPSVFSCVILFISNLVLLKSQVSLFLVSYKCSLLPFVFSWSLVITVQGLS